MILHRMKTGYARLVLLALAAVLILALCGCGKAADKVGEKATEKITEKAMEKEGVKDASVDIDEGKLAIKTDKGSINMNTGSGQKWPDGIPGDVPEFKYGKIVAVMESNENGQKAYTMSLEMIADGAVESYKKDLEAAGFKIDNYLQADTGGSFSGIKNNYTLSLFTDSGNKSGMLVYSPQVQ